MHYRKPSLAFLVITTLFLLLAACTPAPSTIEGPPTQIEPTAPSSAEPTAATEALTAGVVMTSTAAPTVAAETPATDAPPEAEPTMVSEEESASPATDDYLDDRSNAEAVVRSLFNAINSRQYVRAYSYWEQNAEGLPPYEQFEQSFANTDYVDLFDVGEVLTDAGAGQRYFAVPYIISVTNKDGSVEAFAGCYLLHLATPELQATPPFQPLGIRSAAIQQMGEGDDSFTISARLCEEIIAG